MKTWAVDATLFVPAGTEAEAVRLARQAVSALGMRAEVSDDADLWDED